MTAANPPDLAQEFEAALAWWRDAGVDLDYHDDATEWLAEEAPPVPQAVAAAPKEKSAQPAEKKARPPLEKIGGPKDRWPLQLAEFQQWWRESPVLDALGAAPRVPPRGNAEAPLMVIVPEPEETDRDTLLSGQRGELLASFLKAAQVDAEAIYVASALPRHTPMPDWEAMHGAGLGDLLCHHVKLAAPKRVLVFGRNILPLLGHDMAQGSAVLRDFNHDGFSVPLMGAASLGELVRAPARRKRFWHNWLEWTGN